MQEAVTIPRRQVGKSRELDQKLLTACEVERFQLLGKNCLSFSFHGFFLLLFSYKVLSKGSDQLLHACACCIIAGGLRLGFQNIVRPIRPSQISSVSPLLPLDREPSQD